MDETPAPRVPGGSLTPGVLGAAAAFALLCIKSKQQHRGGGTACTAPLPSETASKGLIFGKVFLFQALYNDLSTIFKALNAIPKLDGTESSTGSPPSRAPRLQDRSVLPPGQTRAGEATLRCSRHRCPELADISALRHIQHRATTCRVRGTSGGCCG